MKGHVARPNIVRTELRGEMATEASKSCTRRKATPVGGACMQHVLYLGFRFGSGQHSYYDTLRPLFRRPETSVCVGANSLDLRFRPLTRFR